MQNRGWSAFLLAIVISGTLLTTGCDRIDRQIDKVRSVDAKKKKYMASGKKFLAEKNPLAARQRFGLALRADPNWAYQFGLANLLARDYPRAFRAFQATVEKDPKHYDALRQIASLYLASKRYEEAKTAAEKMLAVWPNDAQAQEIIAYSFAGMGDMEASEKELENLVEHDPSQISATLNLARLKLRNKDKEGAEAVLKNAAETSKPQTAASWTLLANFYLLAGKLPEAEQAYRKAISINPKDPSPQFALGRFLSVNNRLPEAEVVYRKIAEDNSGNERNRSALARFDVARGQVDKGIGELEEIIKKYPEDRSSRNVLTAALIRAGKTDRAMALSNELLQKNSKDAQALLTRGVLNVRLRKTQEAITDLTQVIHFQVDNADAHYYMAMARLQHQEQLPAMQELLDALKYRPAFINARLTLAQIQLDSGAAQTAIETLEAAPKPQNQVPALIMLKSACLIRKGASGEAERMLSNLRDSRPNLGAVQTQYGLLLGEKKDYKGAQAAFEKALAVNKYDSRATLGLALTYLALNQAAAGEKAFEKMVAADPKYGPSVFGMVDLMLAQKKDAAAEKALQTYLVGVPKDPIGLRRMAELRYRQQDYSGSENYYRQALQIAPENTDIMTSLGMVLETEKRAPEAINFYREVLKRRSTDPIAANNLAWLLSEGGGNIDEALKWAQVGKERAPGDPAVIDTLGWIYMKKNNPLLAISEFRDATNKAPKNPLYVYHLGFAQYKAGDTRQAEISMRTALDQKTDFPGIEDARKILKEIQNLKR